MPSTIIPAPYIRTSCAPAMYSGWRGPGMFVTVQLNTGRIRLASDRRADVRVPRPMRPPGIRSDISSSVRAPSALANSLDWCVPSRTTESRSTGSAMSVPSVVNMPETMLPAAARCGFVAHRDRRHRDQRVGGQLALVEQVGAQPAADDGQHDVVDRRPGLGALDRPQIVEVEADARRTRGGRRPVHSSGCAGSSSAAAGSGAAATWRASRPSCGTARVITRPACAGRRALFIAGAPQQVGVARDRLGPPLRRSAPRDGRSARRRGSRWSSPCRTCRRWPHGGSC